MSPKGILKRSSQNSDKSMHSIQTVTWDEENLKTTEQEKQEFKDIVINEPKTPYLYMNGLSSDEDDNMKNPEQPSMSTSPPYLLLSEHVMDNNETEVVSGSNSFVHKAGISGSDWDESDSDIHNDPEREEFEHQRSQHYRIGNLLRKGASIDPPCSNIEDQE
jgi:hypothetical protein